jgi:type IV pilus assembly protein PilA
MKNEQGFSLIELLIVVAIIAIIAAIAVPSLLTARMAANEASAIQGLRTIGSAEIAWASTANQTFDTISVLITNKFLDGRFTNGIDGYTYLEGNVAANNAQAASYAATTAGSSDFGVIATPSVGGSTGRFLYGIGTDQVVRYEGKAGGYTGPDPGGLTAGDGIGSISSGS